MTSVIEQRDKTARAEHEERDSISVCRGIGSCVCIRNAGYCPFCAVLPATARVEDVAQFAHQLFTGH